MSDHPETLQGILAHATRHLQARRIAEAEALFRQILERQPDHAAALHGLGLTAWRRGDYERSQSLIRRAVALDGNFVQAFQNLGAVLLTLGRLEEAAIWNRLTIALDPACALAHFNLGATLVQMGQHESAQASYRHAISIDPASPGPWRRLAGALWNQGKAEEAIACFREAIGRIPEAAQLHFDLGTLLDAQDRHAEAAASFRQAAALAARFTTPPLPLHDVLVRQIMAIRKQGDYQTTLAAVVATVDGLAAVPAHHDALMQLTLELITRGEIGDALLGEIAVIARRRLAADPADSQAGTVVWTWLFRQGRLRLAARLAARTLARHTPERVRSDNPMRLWSNVRADRRFFQSLRPIESCLAELPALHGPKEGAGPDGGYGGMDPVLFFSCDDVYWHRFGKGLLASIKDTTEHANVHFHVIDATPSTLDELALWRRASHLRLNYSHEQASAFTATGDGDGRLRLTYFACIRFLRLYQLLRRYRRPIVQMDVDCRFTADVRNLPRRLRSCDVGLISGTPKHGPFHVLNASFFHVNPTVRAIDYVAGIGAYIAHFLLNRRACWMLDQTAMHCVLDHLQRTGTAPSTESFKLEDLSFCRFGKEF